MLDVTQPVSGAPGDNGSGGPIPGPWPAKPPRSSRVYLSGIQALVASADAAAPARPAAGLNTAGFISGYRGSPLGNLDQALWKAKKLLDESIASTSSRASTRTSPRRRSGARSRSACSRAPNTTACSRMWYGKGPGVDRSMRRAQARQRRRHRAAWRRAGGGGRRSRRQVVSTLPHQSEHIFAAAMIPVLNPAGRAGVSWISASTAGRCRATPAAGSR